MPLNKPSLVPLNREASKEHLKALIENVNFQSFLAWLENMESVHTNQLRSADKESFDRINGKLDTYQEIFNYINEQTK